MAKAHDETEASTPPEHKCLDDELIAAFVELRLDSRENRRVEEHVDVCDDCRWVVAEASRQGPSSTGEGTPAATSKEALTRPALIDAGLNVSAGEGSPDELLGIGDRIDHFEVVRAVGSGGMGQVYLARDTSLGRSVALKVLRRDRLASKELTARLRLEGRTMAKFDHPNIVPVHHVGDHHGTPYVAMQYVRGETLAERLMRGPIPLDEALAIARSVASAIREAHRLDVAHRDLKPANVLMGDDGRVRVVDFGLAKLVGLLESSGETTMNLTEEIGSTGVAGSPYFMAPEQWSGEAGLAGDLWAFGVMLHSLLTGRLPFRGATLKEQRALVTGASPPPNLNRDVRLPKRLAELASACLAREPDRRPSADQVVRRLEAIQNAATPDTAARRWQRWLGAALLVGAAAAVVSLFVRSTPPTATPALVGSAVPAPQASSPAAVSSAPRLREAPKSTTAPPAPSPDPAQAASIRRPARKRPQTPSAASTKSVASAKPDRGPAVPTYREPTTEKPESAGF